MMKTLMLLAVAILAPIWAAEEATKLPPAIQAIVEKAEADVFKNRKVYDAANSKSLDAAEKALKAELEKMTKAGKLEEAMAAKKMLESVRAYVVARVDELATKGGGSLLGDDTGTISIAEGKAIQQWDNASPYKMSPSPHDLSFAIKFDSPVASFWFRAKPGYGCERISYTFDNGNPTGMARESEVKLKNPKALVRVKGTHAGSNDEFAYGPLQYKTAPTDEWKDIPASMLSTG